MRSRKEMGQLPNWSLAGVPTCRKPRLHFAELRRSRYVHLEAKIYTHLHPHGTGSLRAESDRCSMSECLKDRLLSLQRDFRRLTVLSFQSPGPPHQELLFQASGSAARQAQLPVA